MKNRIYYVNEEEFSKISESWKGQKDLYSVVVDGKELHTWEQFKKAMIKEFRLPMDETGVLNAYLDWMRDLDWLQSEAYALAVLNFDMLLSEEIELKDPVVNDFKEYILPWWEKDVVDCCVGGYPKSFNVYFVSDK